MEKSLLATMKVLSLVSCICGMVLSGSSAAWAQQKGGSLRQQIIGTWSLVSQYVEQDGKKIERLGPDPKGMAIYERNGQFVQILQRRTLPKFASNNAMTGTADENKAVVQGSIAYFGTYTVDDKEGIVTGHVNGSTFPNWDGENQKRKATISGDEMKIVLPGAAIGGTAYTVWKRIK